nr:VENN motif pre-toxin domain-containing protein [Xanthomonas arboricola]
MTGGALAGAGGELAAKYLTQTLYGDDPRAIDPVTGKFNPNLLPLYGDDPRAIDPVTGKFNPNLLPEQDKQMLVALSQAVGAIAGGLAGGSLTCPSRDATLAPWTGRLTDTGSLGVPRPQPLGPAEPEVAAEVKGAVNVYAETTIGGENFSDVNQSSTNPIYANPYIPTLISERIAGNSIKNMEKTSEWKYGQSTH